MCDQLRFDALGCYGNGIIRTPNIDRLAARGVTFDNAYSNTPVCMPARHSLISGQNAFEIDMADNCRHYPFIRYPLARQLKNKGYYTCAVGKMHFMPAREHFGFDKLILSEELPGHICDDEYLQFLCENGYSHVGEPNGKRSENYYKPQVSPLPENVHSDFFVAENSIRVIEKNRNRNFFLFTSFVKPHPPFEPCGGYERMYPPESLPEPSRTQADLKPLDRMVEVQNDYKINGIENITKEQEALLKSRYYGCITQLDVQVGRILDALDKYGLTEETLIIFTSDHGEMMGDHYSYGKRTYFEQSCRIPMIISKPGECLSGLRDSQLVSLKDVYSTILEYAGEPIPEICSGLSLYPLLKGCKIRLRDKLTAEFGYGVDFKCMMRFGKYKYIYFADGGAEALYDLESDPEEFINVASVHGEISKKCRKELAEYYSAFGFKDAVQDGVLVKYPKTEVKRRGYLDQSPVWQKSIL